MTMSTPASFSLKSKSTTWIFVSCSSVCLGWRGKRKSKDSSHEDESTIYASSASRWHFIFSFDVPREEEVGYMNYDDILRPHSLLPCCIKIVVLQCKYGCFMPKSFYQSQILNLPTKFIYVVTFIYASWSLTTTFKSIVLLSINPDPSIGWDFGKFSIMFFRPATSGTNLSLCFKLLNLVSHKMFW